MPDATHARIEDLVLRADEAVRQAEKRAADRQHPRGKLTVRERVERFVDPGSFVQIDAFTRHRGGEDDRPYGDGIVAGHATVDGRPVCLYAQDFAVFGGSLGEASAATAQKVLDLAVKIGCPVVGINDGGGARIQEGVAALAGYAGLARRHAAASGVVPQISLILGPCAGGAVYTPALTDFTVVVRKTSYMVVTGPDVVRAATGVEATLDELGGADTNATVSGNAHHLADDEDDALDWVRTLLGFLPANNRDPVPEYADDTSPGLTATDYELRGIVPDSENAAYDVTEVVSRVVDDGDLLAVHDGFARNMFCAFGRVAGRTVGVVANQPAHNAGVLDIDASEKAARFVRFCDAFGIPILTFADVPGYLPGVEQERGGIIRRGAKLVYAYSEATVPLVTVVVRKAYGGGYAVMGSKHLGADVNLAWPTARIAVVGAEGAVQVLHRRELAGLSGAARAEREREIADRLRHSHSSPYLAAELGYVDAVIDPADTRVAVARALRLLRGKTVGVPFRKHGNIPL
ncbi:MULTISPECIES: acyl-CoA carboxylase subunit beta [Actinokineospora]|uniref:Methylmalonyl-CoA carboxyltransferase n=1 Tax=Actinokineospora fastidiosa TaxID=1816 RepID=A0A918LK51_9PSEU|nr:MULTISPECIES: acyl-CoA carboxylase subunit beta [Actinokineospora]UVS78944.1 putative propionyl-CoA carboxylase beta chain 5 [Actinokineospora sp. UTMC 2448]GGS60934.1 methylmalonyl-CoA carboxyltransferase [Actinokineospora fastidiosa]